MGHVGTAREAPVTTVDRHHRATIVHGELYPPHIVAPLRCEVILEWLPGECALPR
jgi:hypothetical protein